MLHALVTGKCRVEPSSQVDFSFHGNTATLYQTLLSFLPSPPIDMGTPETLPNTDTPAELPLPAKLPSKPHPAVEEALFGNPSANKMTA